jgi:hypothetical protein
MEAPAAELSPLDVIALEAALEPFCPQALEGHYRPGTCLPWCRVCADLLLQRTGVGTDRPQPH